MCVRASASSLWGSMSRLAVWAGGWAKQSSVLWFEKTWDRRYRSDEWLRNLMMNGRSLQQCAKIWYKKRGFWCEKGEGLGQQVQRIPPGAELIREVDLEIGSIEVIHERRFGVFWGRREWEYWCIFVMRSLVVCVPQPLWDETTVRMRKVGLKGSCEELKAPEAVMRCCL